ncbi:proto-oncogene c-Rel-like [Asterias rubens]|uniref:proto-oncogene c-Rel-like n=1 Tax=Asterias rubens TaxID=7604 RepID=UPI001455B53A|nr:proto-oncogene c-Rel-like [Asterias rubens]
MSAGRGQDFQDDPMRSIESSNSFSLDNVEPGLLAHRTNLPSTSIRGATNDPSEMDRALEAMLLKNDTIEPSLEITEQPKQRDLRFRYECEGRSAGSLLADRSNDRKIYPTVKVHGYKGRVKLVVSLVTRNTPHQLHPNGLVGKLCENGLCSKIVEPNDKMAFSFPNLGIQCAKKKDIPSALESRQILGVDPFDQFKAMPRGGSSRSTTARGQDYEMNVVCLCFQAFLPDAQHPGQFTVPLSPQVSQPIFDKKGASLNISRVDRNNGSVKGGDEIFILCDKVQKDDIQVVFFHNDWESKAIFGPSDIHRQVAIVCRTPKYRDQQIQRPVTVQFKLKRVSDGEMSEPMEFIYKPIDEDADGVEAKRRKKSPHFTRFFGEPTQIKREPGDQVPLLGGCSFTTTQQQTMPTSMSPAVRGMGEPNVKQKLRTKINNKQPTDSHDIRQPPREFAHAGRRVQGNEAGTSSSTVYSHSSNMTFGTVTQREPAATVTTGAPLTFRLPTITDTSMALPFPNTPTAMLINEASQMQFPAGPMDDNASNMPVNYTHFTDPEEPIAEQLLHLLSDENLANLESSGVSAMELLTSMQDFDPASLEIPEDDLNQVNPFPDIREPATDERTLENINDSLSIPYSNSVELDYDPST